MMTVEQIAVLAYEWLQDPGRAAVLAAVDIAESAGDENAVGDAVAGGLQQYADFACQGHLSFGLGQVFLGVHTPMIQQMSGLTTPCDLARWIQDPGNNMRAQAAILANQGFQAWSTWKLNAHLRWLPQAEAAIIAHLGENPPERRPGNVYRPLRVIVPAGTQLILSLGEHESFDEQNVTLAEDAVFKLE